MSIKEINSPYKMTYWSYRNLVASRLGISVDYVPRATYDSEQLKSFDWKAISTALSKGLVEVEGKEASDFQIELSFTFNQAVDKSQEVKELFRVSSNQFVVDFSKLYELYKPENSIMLLDVMELLYALLFTVEVTQEKPYEVKLINYDNRLEKDKNLYYFMLFEYLPVRYNLEPEIVESLNSLLYIDTCRFKGYFDTDLIERSTKREQVDELGIKRGSIVFLYKRNYVVSGSLASTSRGKNPLIESVKLARVKTITETGMSFEVYNFKETLEQSYWEFSQMSQEVQDLYIGFPDYVKNAFSTTTETLVWDSLGIQYVMNNDRTYSEHYFITRLESIHPVNIMSLDNSYHFESLNLSVPDAVYYLLLQYGIKFNESLYLETYNLKNADVIKQAVRESSERLEDLLGYPIQNLS